MKFVQKLGKALMLPVACLPICGILMGLGYAMCPSTMQGGDVTGVVEQIGFFLVKAGGAYLPLAYNAPRSRIENILSNSGAVCLIGTDDGDRCRCRNGRRQ